MRLSERDASRSSWAAAALLFALATYVFVTAALGVVHGRRAEFSLPGIALAAIAIPLTYALSGQKSHPARRLESPALRADAAESVACAYLSAVVVVGLLGQRLFRAWWLDDVASFVIVLFLIREGREAWSGDEGDAKV